MATTHLTGLLEQTRGVIGREPAPTDMYVFEFDSVRERRIHMLGVRSQLRVEFYVEGERVAVEYLQPWIGTAKHRCDEIREMGVPEC
jgi:hypothetical protein